MISCGVPFTRIMGIVNQLLEFFGGGSVDPSGRDKDCRCKSDFARDRRPVDSRTNRFIGLFLHKRTSRERLESLKILSP